MYTKTAETLYEFFGRSYGKMARMAGYKNINRGARRFSALLESGTADESLVERIADMSEDIELRHELKSAIAQDRERNRDFIEAKQRRVSLEHTLLVHYHRELQAGWRSIINTPEFAYTRIYNGQISIAFVSGSGPLPLGVLVQLWQSGESSSQCDHCGGQTRMVSASGSPLNATHHLSGYCASCGAEQTWQKEPFYKNVLDPVNRARKRLELRHRVLPVRIASLKEVIRSLTGQNTEDLIDHDDDTFPEAPESVPGGFSVKDSLSKILDQHGPQR